MDGAPGEPPTHEDEITGPGPCVGLIGGEPPPMTPASLPACLPPSPLPPPTLPYILPGLCLSSSTDRPQSPSLGQRCPLLPDCWSLTFTLETVSPRRSTYADFLAGEHFPIPPFMSRLVSFLDRVVPLSDGASAPLSLSLSLSLDARDSSLTRHRQVLPRRQVFAKDGHCPCQK